MSNMNDEYYKIAVNMLMETIEFHIEGYELELYEEDMEEWLETVINSLKQRIKVVKKFQSNE